MQSSVYELYKNKVRVRSCGLCIDSGRLLMVNHRGLTSGNFWAPPGGGLQFGETLEQCVEREFREETGLLVHASRFLFSCEFIRYPLHAIEMFFLVEKTGGQLKLGNDPEMADNQILVAGRFMSWSEISTLPADTRHGIFNFAAYPSEILDLRGHFKL
jgi:8-oxo-dGTP diphosphatase